MDGIKAKARLQGTLGHLTGLRRRGARGGRSGGHGGLGGGARRVVATAAAQLRGQLLLVQGKGFAHKVFFMMEDM